MTDTRSKTAGSEVEREADLIEKTALRVGMKSLMNHGAASCVYTEGCDGVSQEHLVAFAREVALHCVATLSHQAASSLVPGQMHCARCKFQLTRTNLYVNSGTVGAGDSKTEPCPNRCGPLWPVTWEQAAREAWATCETLFERAKAAEDALAAVNPPRLAATQPNAAPAAEVVAMRELLAYVLQDEQHNRLTPRVIDIAYTAFMLAKQPNTEDGGSSDWFNDTRPAVRKAVEKMRKDFAALATPAAAIDAREQEATKPDPKNCTAKVRCDNGRITTESCTTKKPLIDDGESSDGERDYYVCPDCGKSITVDYREN